MVLGKKKNIAIFFDIKKGHDKINKWRTFEQLEIIGTQGRMLDTIKELVKEGWIWVRVGETTSQSRKADLGILQGRVLSATLFFVAINDILGEKGNELDGFIFADDLVIYITTRN